jgi:hypothetical protein
MSGLKAVPLTQKEANAFVERLHRHHEPARGDKFRIGADENGQLVGVVQVGRPVSRVLDDGETCEVIRLCTDGTKNTCSFLYARAARIAELMGYKKIITYILESEPGTSLKASGWQKEADIRGKEWSCPSRPRETTAPSCNKQRWTKIF